jgi:hypothetical protein
MEEFEKEYLPEDYKKRQEALKAKAKHKGVNPYKRRTPEDELVDLLMFADLLTSRGV